MDRVLRAALRHPLQLLLLALLPIVIAGLVVYRLPHQYQTTATLWALHKYDALTATSIDYSNVSTPAETQVTALSELVQTHSFSLAVAQEALINVQNTQVHIGSLSNADALATDISANVQVQAQGYDLFTITYTSTNPQMVQSVVAAVIYHYGLQSQQAVAPEEQNQLDIYQAKLGPAQQTLQSIAEAQSQFVQSHPQLTQSQLQNNPQYQLLQNQAQQAQLALQNIQNDIYTLEQNNATHSIIAKSLYKVLDRPIAPSQPVSRLKTFLLGGATGLAVGMIVDALYIALLVRRDRRVYTSNDLHKVTTYPILMELPRLSPEIVALVNHRAGHLDSHSSNGKS